MNNADKERVSAVSPTPDFLKTCDIASVADFGLVA